MEFFLSSSGRSRSRSAEGQVVRVRKVRFGPEQYPILGFDLRQTCDRPVTDLRQTLDKPESQKAEV